MNIVLTIIVFLVIFSLLILIHECGHFFAAKRAGVKVEEFGFGLPPRLWGIKKGETLYSINWIPFGGFVRMLGEDSASSESRASKRSFMNQSLRTQAWIVVAGVVMNLLLAYILLTVGFVMGIEPLISTEEDFANEIRNGTVHLEPGSTDPQQTLYWPRFVYKDNENSLFYGQLQEGDALILVNGEEVFAEEDLYAALRGQTEVTVEAYREGSGTFEVTVNLPDSNPLITYIEEGSPAETAGLQVGDELVSIDGQELTTSAQVAEITQAASQNGEAVEYVISRDGELIILEITPRAEDQRIGIAISDLLPYYGNLSLYLSAIPHTLTGIDHVSYGWAAPIVALEEMGRLAKITAVMFVNVLKEFVTGGDVPAGVSGPVGIAQMTFVTVQDGFAATLRFIALLSLSLGVVNILPIPALDGGKFFFILVQAITGRKMNSRYEHFIHAAGFIFLLLFIVYITFNDVIALF